MVKPAHTRLTLSGVIGTVAAPVEQWSINVNFPPEASAGLTDAALAAKASGAATAWFDNLVPDYPNDNALTKTRVAHVGDGIHVTQRVDGTYVQGDWTDGPITGTQATNGMPLQTALCVSLSTARPGASGKGRFFLPWPAISLDHADKRIPTAQATDLLAGVQGFLQDLSGFMGDDPVIVSSKGFTSVITGIRLGRTPDTMRSRREDSPEGYLLAPLHP